MLSDIRIKQTLTSSEDSIDLVEVIRQKKILLVRVPQGQLDPSANLLGSLVITGLRQAAISISVTEFGAPTPVALYVDELDNFVDCDTFGFISTESRRYQIGITGTVRTLQGLPEMYRNQILANVGTMCTFALARKDAEMLGPQMFRVDGRKYKHRPIQAFFNPLSTSPQFELITDEEKLNIDRLIGLDRSHFFCYRVGTTAGVLKVRAHQFGDPKPETIKKDLVEDVYRGTVNATADRTIDKAPTERAQRHKLSSAGDVFDRIHVGSR